MIIKEVVVWQRNIEYQIYDNSDKYSDKENNNSL
jgi:hypothetical protein